MKRRLGNAAFTRPRIQQDVKKAVAGRGFQEFVKGGECFDLCYSYERLIVRVSKESTNKVTETLAFHGNFLGGRVLNKV